MCWCLQGHLDAGDLYRFVFGLLRVQGAIPKGQGPPHKGNHHQEGRIMPGEDTPKGSPGPP